MYNPEITQIINENLKLSLAVGILIKTFYSTSDVAYLHSVEDIHKQIAENQRKIEKLRVEAMNANS